MFEIGPKTCTSVQPVLLKKRVRPAEIFRVATHCVANIL